MNRTQNPKNRTKILITLLTLILLLTNVFAAGVNAQDPELTPVTRDITANTDFVVMCSFDNITSFSGITFEITYDPAKVTLVDFAAQTTEANVSVGAVAGTDLEILSHNTSTGELTFSVDKAITSGETWSGTLTILKFNALVTGSTTIDFDIAGAVLPDTAKSFSLTEDGDTAFTWSDNNAPGVVTAYIVQKITLQSNGLWTS